jgi:thiaminase/transcriptional activator TenA
VLDAGHSGDLLDLLAALAPCVMGYGEIGNHLAATKTSDTYADWINTYASAEYQQVCHDVGELIDAAITRRLGNGATASPRWASLQARFAMATRLEVGFWDMGLDP